MLFFAFLLVTTSCSINRKFKESVALRTDLVSTFGHENIVISQGQDADTDYSYTKVTYCRYDLSSKPFHELQDMAKEIDRKLFLCDPSVDYTEVIFTNGDTHHYPKACIRFRAGEMDIPDSF